MSRARTKFSVSPFIWRVVSISVTASVAWLTARRLWATRKLNQKLDRKRQRCQETLKQIEQELTQCRLPTAKKDSIVSLPLSTLQSKLQTGELKAEDVLRAYQDKALAVNASINCVVEAITEAREQVVICDKTGDESRLLHGIPLSLKENIGVKGYDTTAGLQINVGIPCEEDSVVVQVFKRHGAIPFVRTNIPQAMLSFTCSNPIFGVTANPHNTDHCPGGSSGGEGAILGGGASIIGLGTDVGGSVRVPAAFCGVCALKPTEGRFSKLGVYTVSKGQTLITGCVGPMARDVHSLVTMIKVMTSPDMFQLDPSLPPIPFQEHLLNSTYKLKIGCYTWDGNFPSVPVVCRAVQEARSALEALGHTVVDFSPPDYSEMYGKLYIGTMVSSGQIKRVLKAVKGDYVDEGINLWRMFQLPQWIFLLLVKILLGSDVNTLKTAKRMNRHGSTFSWFCHTEEVQTYRTRFIKEWRNQGLDAVICPVFPCPAPKTAHIASLTGAGSGCALYNVLNFPAGVLPVTRVTAQDVADVNNPKLFVARNRLEGMLKNSCDTEKSVGLPVAIQCVTLPFMEELCLRLMGELETALNYNGL